MHLIHVEILRLVCGYWEVGRRTLILPPISPSSLSSSLFYYPEETPHVISSHCLPPPCPRPCWRRETTVPSALMTTVNRPTAWQFCVTCPFTTTHHFPARCFHTSFAAILSLSGGAGFLFPQETWSNKERIPQIPQSTFPPTCLLCT